MQVRIDDSSALVTLLVLWTFSTRFTVPGRSGAASLGLTAVASALSFSSVLAHQVVEALEARHRSVTVRSITLFRFGGVPQSRSEAHPPRVELALAAAGPFVSFGLAAVAGMTVALVRVSGTGASPGLAAVAEVIEPQVWINVGLGGFSLLLGAPLVAGRIVGSARSGPVDRWQPERVVARMGQVLGAGMLTLGVVRLLLVPTSPVAGMWLVALGWCLSREANWDLARVRLAAGLELVDVAALVGYLPAALPAAMPATEASPRAMDWDADTHQLVVGPGGTQVIDLDRLLLVASTDRSAVLGDLARPAHDLPAVDVAASAADLLASLGECSLVVIEDRGRPVGVVSAERIGAALSRHARRCGAVRS